jgi:DNA polymerase III epsilon subunit-like protein
MGSGQSIIFVSSNVRLRLVEDGAGNVHRSVLMSGRRCATPCLKRSATMAPHEYPASSEAAQPDNDADQAGIPPALMPLNSRSSHARQGEATASLQAISGPEELGVSATGAERNTESRAGTVSDKAPSALSSGSAAPDVFSPSLGSRTSRFRWRAPPAKAPRIIPRASQLVVLPPGTPSVFPMPEMLKAKLSSTSRLVLGLDVETNDWEKHDAIKGSIGEHGFYNICCPSDLEARIVQLGWAIRDETGIVIVEKIVKPDAWAISEKATAYHGISQEEAIANGVALAHVLREFMRDVYDVCQRGGRLVSHHLEFDAGILLREMRRVGMDDAGEWSRMVRACGFCTMCPELGRWLSQCFGRDAGAATTMNTMKLKDMVTWLLPLEKRVSVRFHTAGLDAQMHVEVYLAVLALGGL